MIDHYLAAAAEAPAQDGRFVASMTETQPLTFQPGTVMTALEWLLETPPYSSMEGAALASFLPSVHSLLSYGTDGLQHWLAALQRSAGLTLEQAGQLVLRQPDVLRSSSVYIEAAAERLRQLVPADTLNALLARQPQLLVAPQQELEQLLRALRLWTQVIGVSAEAVLARYDSLKRRTDDLLRCDEATPGALQERLAALQQEGGLTAEAASSLAAAHPDLLLTPVTVLQSSAAWLRQHLPADVFSGIFSPGSRLLAASDSRLGQLRNTLQLWREVLSTPLDTVLQQYKQCFLSTHQLAEIDPARLQARMASLQQRSGMSAEQARAAAAAHADRAPARQCGSARADAAGAAAGPPAGQPAAAAAQPAGGFGCHFPGRTAVDAGGWGVGDVHLLALRFVARLQVVHV